MSAGRRDAISDGAMLAVIGCVAVVLGTLWLWGGLAGALFGSGWPRVGPGGLLGVLIRLPARLSDPARAWPPAARPQLPRAGGFYGALGLLLGVSGAAALIAAR